MSLAVKAFDGILSIVIYAIAVKMKVFVIVRMLPDIFQGSQDLKVEPGAYSPWAARFKSWLWVLALSVRAAQSVSSVLGS